MAIRRGTIEERGGPRRCSTLKKERDSTTPWELIEKNGRSGGRRPNGSRGSGEDRNKKMAKRRWGFGEGDTLGKRWEGRKFESWGQTSQVRPTSSINTHGSMLSAGEYFVAREACGSRGGRKGLSEGGRRRKGIKESSGFLSTDGERH